MRSHQLICGGVLAALAVAQAQAGQALKVLHQFGQGTDGYLPLAGLTPDAHGNYFGTAEFGGLNELGNVYKLSPNGKGGWTYTDIYDFTGGSDGGAPGGAVLVDAKGNIYGNTCCLGGLYQGTVYELSPSKNGTYSITNAYSFKGNPDGAQPLGGLAMDAAGNLFGTTNEGGKGNIGYGYGTVYEIETTGQAWQEKIIYRSGTHKSGYESQAPMTLGPDGNLYGTDGYGGKTGDGTVFRIVPSGDTWTYEVIYDFARGGGSSPHSAPVFDAKGNLYATASFPQGTVFKLRPPKGAEKSWKETTLYSFTGGADGGYPYSGITLGADGSIYGVTSAGGNTSGPCQNHGGCGVIYKLTKSRTAPWLETVLWTFSGNAGGGEPYSVLVPGPGGRYYGTAYGGDVGNSGDIFSIRK
jgi:uncharacterized repeat protein (TIGR03803 family)